MNSIILYFLLFNFSYGFIHNNILKRSPIKMSSSNDSPPEIWQLLSKNLKNTARDWFVQRAEKVGIDWYGLVAENRKDMERLKELYKDSSDNSIVYPKYYTQPFHGYDTGNLNWDAALEGEAATLSMAINYWKEANPIKTQDWLRYNITNNIKQYINNYSPHLNVNSIMDVGCSVGISTEFLYKTFRDVETFSGIDLSPFFIAMATLRSEKFDFPIKYFHKNAENMHSFSDNSYDLIVCNFIFHELPEEASKNILREVNRILKPGGVLAIIDLTPKVVNDNFLVSRFRKWAFEVTEPHIYGYYKRDLKLMMEDSNFFDINSVRNDPINTVWMGVKLDTVISPEVVEKDENEKKESLDDVKKNNEKKRYTLEVSTEGTLLEYLV